MKKIILFTLLFVSAIQLSMYAQSGGTSKGELFFRTGESEYKNQRYMYALPFFRTSLQFRTKHDSLLLLHMADSYWFIKNYDSALIFYQKFENKYGSIYSSSQRIAELLATVKNYPEAVDKYKKVIKKFPSKNQKQLEERLKGFSNPIPMLKDSLDYAIRLLNLNTKQQDFSPFYYQRGLVFVSSRYAKTVSEKEFGWDGLPFSCIYWVQDTADLYLIDTVPGHSSRSYNASIKANDDYTSRTSNDNDVIVVSTMQGAYTGSIHKLLKFSDDLNSKYNYGPLCFNKKEDKIYFTRNALTPYKGRYNLEICVASLKNGLWGDIKVMPFVKTEYDYFHPAISSDDQLLYFCSNQPGGQGGSDIYYISLATDYGMTLPISMDNKVNTTGNELFPTVSGDTLYFSTDGLAGLGGLDIYKFNIGRGFTKPPINLGYPINSSFDDFGFIINETKRKGFFTSNRLGTDDIYVFDNTVPFINLEGTVLDSVSAHPIYNVKVILQYVDKGKALTDTAYSDALGKFYFPLAPRPGFTLQFTNENYYDDSLKVPPVVINQDLVLQPFLLRKPPLPPPPPVIVKTKPKIKDGVDKKGIQKRLNELAKMVFFANDKSELTPEAMKPLLEAAEIIKDFPKITLIIEGHTDNNASAAYNKDLSQRRANTVRSFFVQRGFDPKKLTANGYGLERPIATNSTVEGKALNRRVSIVADFHEE